MLNGVSHTQILNRTDMVAFTIERNVKKSKDAILNHN